MVDNIKESFSILNEKKGEIKDKIRLIELKKREYEDVFSSLNSELSILKSELKELRENVVSVKLGDLLDELSWLSGANLDKIKSSIKFSMHFASIEHFYEMIDDIKDNGRNHLVKNVRFRLWNELDKQNLYSVPFDYFTFLDFDLRNIQNDGSLLIEHFMCEIEPYSNEEIFVTFSLEKNINDVICNFNLGSLKSESAASWYPGDLFLQAIVNCSQKYYNLKVDKIREKVRTLK